MLGFLTYLTEAKVSQKNLEKVVDIFKRLLEKRMATKFYRFGGPKGYCEIKNGIGILYFYNRNKAIRFNYSQGEIVSITLWNQFKLGQKGDRTIDLGGLGLLSGAHKLLEVIAQGAKIGKYMTFAHGDIKESVESDLSFLTEAKRIAPADFYNLVNDNLSPGQSIKNLSWGVIADIAASNDFQVPTVVRNKCKVKGSGLNAIYDLTNLITGQAGPEAEVDSAKDTKSDTQYYLKITAQDMNTKKFLSVKGDQKAAEMYAKIQNAIKNPDFKKEAKDTNTLFGHMVSLVRVVARGSRNALVIYGGPGTGKAQPLNSLIKVPGGWKRMGDIKFGDEVITPTGDITKVTGIYPQGYKDVYEFTFEDGRTAQATEDHLWKVINQKRNKEYVISTKDIMSRAYKSERYCIPLVTHENVRDKNLEINPYVMGVILGDGCLRGMGLSISNKDKQLIEKVNHIMFSEGYEMKKVVGDNCDYRVTNSMGYQKNNHRYMNYLKKNNLLGLYSNEKFIPEEYKNSSLNQKLELIRGLMDSDGTVDQHGSIYYTTTSERLKNDFVELIRSIGGLAFVKEKQKTYEYNGEKKSGKISYDIRVRYRDPKSLFYLDRKKERVSNESQYRNCELRITDIKKLDNQEECQCISVLDSNRLYVTDNYVTTHNTFNVTETLKSEGLVKDKDWHVVKGKITTVLLYQTLFMHRKGGILVFDDTDSIWGDSEAANILKAALDSYDERTISWLSARTTNVTKMSPEDREILFDDIDKKLEADPDSVKKFPSQFNYEGRIIFISNLSKDKFDTAVLSRAAAIDMTLTPDQMYRRIESILEHVGNKNVPLSAKQEILQFLRDQTAQGLLDEPNMRTFVAAEDLYMSGTPNWKELLEYV